MTLAISFMLCKPGYSQIPYNLYTTVATYTPLTGGVSLNGSHVWDSYSDNYAANMSFMSKIDTAHFETCFLGSENTFVTDSSDTSYISGFFLEDADLIDRGTISGVSASPIRYEVAGAPGSRVFKLEIANAGFHAEYDNYGTLNDFINMQVWVYEGSNIVELHYGTSRISHGNDYFYFSGMPLVGMIDNVSPNGDGIVYILSGDAPAPFIDSMILSGGTPSYMGRTLSSFPPAGTVYRFIPKRLSVKDLTFSNTHLYPTDAQDEVMIDYNSSDVAWYKVVSIAGNNTNVNGKLQSGVNHIDISVLPKGDYFMQLGNKDGATVRKFVKQ